MEKAIRCPGDNGLPTLNLWSSIMRRQQYFGLLCLSPALILLIGLTLYPLFQVGYISLFRFDYASGAKSFFGAGNYLEILGDRLFLSSIRNTAVFTITAAAAEVLGGLLLALLLNRPFPGRSVILPLIILPIMLSTMVVSAIWRAWFHFDYGLLNHLLRSVGLEGIRWLFDPDVALLSIVLVDFWQWMPLAFIVILAGLQSIPPDLYEAARVDGASDRHLFRFITMPLIRTPLLLAILLRTVDSFKLFDKVYALTGGFPKISSR